jgi:hypothetical protein
MDLHAAAKQTLESGRNDRDRRTKYVSAVAVLSRMLPEALTAGTI